MKPTVPLNIPPGFVANGTEHQVVNRFVAGNRVRWHNGRLQPIGGWRKLSVQNGVSDKVISNHLSQTARSIIHWTTSSGLERIVVGGDQSLIEVSSFLVSNSNITPVGMSVSSTSDRDDGYGGWDYGVSNYGLEVFDNLASPDYHKGWCLRSYGDSLIACNRNHLDEPLYYWNGAGVATAIADAPVGTDCVHVTDERIVMAAGVKETGIGSSSRLISWSAAEDHEDWTPTDENEAGSQQLTGKGRFREIVTFRGGYLLVSLTDAHFARYVGPPFIYGFEEVGTDCGVISGNSVVVTDNFVVWPSDNGFKLFDGIVRDLECDVLDTIQGMFEVPTAYRTSGFLNSDWDEVWWLFSEKNGEPRQSGIPTNNDSYVAWNFVENFWYTGTLARSAATNRMGTRPILMMGTDGYLYEHELREALPYEDDEDTDALYAATGPLRPDNRNLVQKISGLIPDLEAGVDGEGVVNISFTSQDRPGGPERSFGPYEVEFPPSSNQPVPTRVSGKTVKMRVEGSHQLWKMGPMRVVGTVSNSK